MSSRQETKWTSLFLSHAVAKSPKNATKCYFVSGRDITSRILMHFHGIGLDDNDDKGRPPYPLLKNLKDTELDYLKCWLDHYALNQDDSPRSFVGYLKEFKEQQNSESTTFVLPPIP